MKKIVLFTLAAITALPLLAQPTGNFFDQLTNKYSDKDGFSASMITSDMFDLYLKKKKLDEPSPVYEALKNLDKIMIISQNSFSGRLGYAEVYTIDPKPEKSEKDATADELHKELIEHYKAGNYTLLKTEKRMGEDIKVYLKKNQDKVEAIALVTNSPNSTSLIELQGDIDLANVAELNQTLNLRGLENLYKINNSEGQGFYGLNTGVIFSREKAEELKQMQRKIFEEQRAMSEDQRAALAEQAKISAEKQMQMTQKIQQMAEQYKRQPIFLTYPGDTNAVYYLNGKKVDAKDIKDIEKEDIKTIEVNKGTKEGEKTTIRIKTK